MIKCALTFVFLAVLSAETKAQDMEFCVKNITSNEGLSNNTIRDILQDSMGYMWFCTPNGLNRYDGSSIQQFSTTGPEGQCLLDARTRRIFEDGKGHLWISCMSDIFSCYDMQQKQFVDLTCNGKYKLKYSSCIYIDDEMWLYGMHAGGAIVRLDNDKVKVTTLSEKSGILASSYVNFVKKGLDCTWIGTEKGLYKWDGMQISCLEKSKFYIAYLADDDSELFLTNKGDVTIIYADGKTKVFSHPVNTLLNNICGAAKWHNLWVVYAENGCVAFDILNEIYCEVPQEVRVESARRFIRDNMSGTWVSDQNHNLLYIGDKKGVVKHFSLIPPDMLMQTHEFFSVYHGKDDIIWISTTGNGLFAYDTEADELKHFTSDPRAGHSIPSNHLKYVYQDRSGCIWLGTALAGISQLQFTRPQGSRYLGISDEYDSFKNQIRFVRKMDDGKIMLGNRNGELYTADFLPHEQLHLNLVNRYSSIVYCTAYDNSGQLWVGTKGGGLHVGQTHYTSSPSLETSLSSNNVTDIIRDDSGRMWISTFGGGLNYAIPDGNGGYRFRRFFDNTEDCDIRMICRDHNGWFWLATSNGVIIFEPDHLLADPTRYVRLQEEGGLLSTNEIRALFCDQSGMMWISETGKGLATCQPTGNYSSLKLEHYTALNGIVMPMIQSFEQDRKGKIWVSTEDGMFCFDPTTRMARRHYFSYGMLRSSFCENSSENLDGRYLLFGSNNGILLLDTDELLPESYPSQVRVSTIMLNGVEYIKPDVRVPYNFNSLELSFSNFDYSSPMPTPYMYMLEGVDTCWTLPVCKSSYKLSRLSSGHYKLHVKAFTEGSGWSDELVLSIHVEKPLWRKWWFVMLYCLFLLGIIFLVRYQYLRHKGLVESYEHMETKMVEVKKMFVEEIISNPSEGPNSDKQFLETLESIVKEEMSNPDFTSEDLARRMNMSHTTFYNTAHRLLGKSPKEYIRHFRMKEAARLLVTSNNNVSQIAFMVGYNDVSYFSKNFKKHFDMSPLRYKAENSKS